MNSLSQRDSASNVTRRALLAAPATLVAAATGFCDVPPLPVRRPRPQPHWSADARVSRSEIDTLFAVAPVGSAAAARLERAFENKVLTFEGRTYNPLMLCDFGRTISLALLPTR